MQRKRNKDSVNNNDIIENSNNNHDNNNNNNNSELDSGQYDDSNFVRRSERNPSNSLLERKDVQILLEKIRNDHEETIILKIKDHILADLTSGVVDELISALYDNNVCQALYVQNLPKAMTDIQIKALLELLKCKNKIWCLNIGENYDVTTAGWKYFCDTLPITNITHLYVSEHTIDIKLKNKMRDNIRVNRKKHDLHNSLANIKVIEKCTNMWWNPINTIKHQLEAEKVVYESSDDEEEEAPRRRKLDPSELTEEHTAYWAQGVGKGGETPWKFSCICGETCSSYENYRYHPVGRMYECTKCSIWSHVHCVLGKISENKLKELDPVLCNSCKTKERRQKLGQLKNMGAVWVDGQVVFLE